LSSLRLPFDKRESWLYIHFQFGAYQGGVMALADSVVSTQAPNAPWLESRVTSQGKPITWYVDEQVENGNWKFEVIPAEVVGLSRPLSVFRAPRHTNLITYDWHGDEQTFCPPMWWDLAIGSGACGLGCRACFLML